MPQTHKRPVRRPHDRVARLVSNKSSRGSAKPTIIVLHTTEGHDRPGISDLESLGEWFDNPAAQASSHVGVDAEGFSALFVRDFQKAWTQMAFNPVALSIEMIGYAAFSDKIWGSRRKQREKVAKYLAYWSAAHGIPLKRARVDKRTGAVKRPGVTTHNALGAIGGGHHDPGRFFPMHRTLVLARKYAREGW